MKLERLMKAYTKRKISEEKLFWRFSNCLPESHLIWMQCKEAVLIHEMCDTLLMRPNEAW